MPAHRKFAVFDIDGTLIRWQLYHALADELAHSGQLDSAQYKVVKVARLNWKKRATGSSFKAYETALVALIDDAISSISVDTIDQASQRVIEKYKDQVYTYTRDLVRDLKAKDYLLFAISASQAHIVGLVANYYGFDDFGGSEYEIKNGRFTGQSTVLKRDRKPEYLKQLVAKHHASWESSIAVGDSESDIPMLETVELPIAFNPTRELFEHAQHKGWKVVVERKNVIYELEPHDGSYLLAQTD